MKLTFSNADIEEYKKQIEDATGKIVTKTDVKKYLNEQRVVFEESIAMKISDGINDTFNEIEDNNYY